MTASTSRLCDPKLLLFVRITQLFLCPTFLVLLCYAVAHRGYWTKTSGALALGIITSLFNLAVSSYHLYTAHYLKRISQTWFTRMSRYLVELLLVLMWAATTALMVRPKGKDFRLAFDKPPKVIWIMCIATAVHQV
ncbi:MAG: hypothetical protein M1827_000228 [Pycnora praestabilis]|nr:MAG: hypothetical protein M1827_000228 [Pycnora praestabilis]